MHFEDEKDNIENDQNSYSDDLISWDGIIGSDDNNDGIVSIKNEKPSMSDVSLESFGGEEEESITVVDDSSSDDELDLSTLQDNSSDSNDEIDEEELKRILGSDADSEVEYVDNDDFDTESQPEEKPEELGEVELNNDDEILPRKEEEKQKKKGVSPILIALLFGVIVAGIIYLIFNFMSNRDEDVEQVKPPINEEQLNFDDENNNQNNENPQNQDANIPVVNEEEVSELKPEEKEQEEEEKKEVVNVIPTGRTDPFVPLSKYVYKEPAPPKPSIIVKTKTINNIDYDSVSIPKPPKQYGELSDITTKLMSITVTGIMYDTQKPSAIINYESNDYFVQIGDKLDNFRVVDIGPNYVKIALGKNVYKANVGEQFKITSEFYGNNAYQGNSRQYYSSEDEFIRRTENAKKYTSADDVQINLK